jgi:hypothetical protein
MKKTGLFLIIVGALFVGGCSVMYHKPPGHDPAGPGNSENAPGHNKEHVPPGQAKK